MTTTVGAIGTAPTPTAATIGDERIDLTLGVVYRNSDGRHWRPTGKSPEQSVAALLASSGSQVNLSRGVVVIAADQTTPPAGTPAGTVVYKRTS